MHRIEYEIKLNENGRPCIELSKEYEDKPEDKFFVFELTRYILGNIYEHRRMEFDQESNKNIEICITVLGQLGDEIAELLWQGMKILGDSSFLLGKNYHISVTTIEERNNLEYKNIIESDKIYERQEGLKVLVTNEMKIYELKGGIDNENWSEVI